MGFASFLSSAGGASLIGGGMGLTASALQHEQNKSLNRQQFQYNKTMYQNRHQWETEDLEKSGLNPALSANSGATQSTGAGQTAQNPFGTAASMIQTLASAKQADAETQKINAETTSILKNNGWIDKKTQSEIEEAYSRIASNKATTAMNKETTKKIRGGKMADWFGTDPAYASKTAYDFIKNASSPMQMLGSEFGNHLIDIYRAVKG